MGGWTLDGVIGKGVQILKGEADHPGSTQNKIEGEIDKRTKQGNELLGKGQALWKSLTEGDPIPLAALDKDQLKALQRGIGVGADGNFGPGSKKKLVEFAEAQGIDINTLAVDGTMSNPPTRDEKIQLTPELIDKLPELKGLIQAAEAGKAATQHGAKCDALAKEYEASGSFDVVNNTRILGAAALEGCTNGPFKPR